MPKTRQRSTAGENLLRPGSPDANPRKELSLQPTRPVQAESSDMKSKWSKLSFRFMPFVREDGQDLVEYALLVGLLALGVTAGIGSYAAKVGTVFSNLATTFSTVF